MLSLSLDVLKCLTLYLEPTELCLFEELKGIKFKYDASHYEMTCDTFNYVFEKFERIIIVGINISVIHGPLCKSLDRVTCVKLKGFFQLTIYKINWKQVRVIVLDHIYQNLLGFLKECINLRSISLRNMHQTKNINFLKECTKLRIVKLWEMKGLSDLKGLSLCRRMKVIDLEGVYILNCDFLKGFDKLRVLSLYGVEFIQDTTLDFVGKYKKLRYLCVQHSQAENVDSLSHCTNLRVAILPHNVCLLDVNGLSKCSKLEHVNLMGCRKLHDVSGLANCSKLEYVNLLYCWGLGNAKGLHNHRNLKYVNMRNTCVILPLRGCPKLENFVTSTIAGVCEKESRDKMWDEFSKPHGY